MWDPHFIDEVKFRIVFVNLFFRSEVLPEKKNHCLTHVYLVIRRMI